MGESIQPLLFFEELRFDLAAYRAAVFSLIQKFAMARLSLASLLAIEALKMKFQSRVVNTVR